MMLSLAVPIIQQTNLQIRPSPVLTPLTALAVAIAKGFKVENITPTPAPNKITKTPVTTSNPAANKAGIITR
ncbi:serine threonine-protein phosphatase 2a regulatory subunit b subunit alpha isoform x1 [Lasius niger]|uniref:Serine threonine-protein phosphatase 2a regulatory subunit b subunit alpha isoform x1 n=1 Tax=Lasius niger TaxID=67767 RepID=A0A0J7KTM3_LASNI|nr:serine threonine-protein phosphatase 2a regulatory subunit b subunit alpha isoform x1 [Lasius niger]